jgi:hypothetical protein
MQTTRLAKSREIAPANDLTGAKPVVRRGDQYAGVHADYRRDHYIFPRSQSQEMRQQEWEDRLPPLRHWGSNLVANLAWQILA